MALKVKRLDPRAKLPVVAHPGYDLGYDVFALEDETIHSNRIYKIRTGIAIHLDSFGFKIFDRSSLSLDGLVTVGGVIDEGYRGEIFINVMVHRQNYIQGNFCNNRDCNIIAGTKIAQLVPMKTWTMFPVEEVSELPASTRGANGYGSTGQ